METLFSQGDRVIAIASRAHDGAATLATSDEKGLTFEGLLTFADRVKADAEDSLKKLQALGVEVKIITGRQRPRGDQSMH